MPPKSRSPFPVRERAPWERLATEFGLDPDRVSIEVEAVLKKAAMKIATIEGAVMEAAALVAAHSATPEAAEAEAA